MSRCLPRAMLVEMFACLRGPEGKNERALPLCSRLFALSVLAEGEEF
jgi:hypothetical protein